MQKNTLYIFLDESGNLDFSEKGTNHFVLSAVITTKPIQISKILQELKYNINLNNLDFSIDGFHASEDKQEVRNFVFEQMISLSDLIEEVHCIYCKKSFCHNSKRTPEKFYSLLGGAICTYILKHKHSQFNSVMIVFDKALSNRSEKAFLKELKKELNTKKDLKYRILFHKTLSDFNAQLADYFAWSQYVALERNESRPLDSIKKAKINHTTFNIFKSGNTDYGYSATKK